MPGFSTWGERSQNTRMPLTPPDTEYCYSNGIFDQSRYLQSTPGFRTGYNASKQYGQAPTYGTQQGFGSRSQLRSNMQVPHDFNQLGQYASQFSSNRSYVPDTAAPILPPLRSHDVADSFGIYAPTSIQPPLEQKPKEEKTTGGVAAHLDYDMSTMADFVAEMSQGMYDMFQSGLCLSDIDLMRSVNQNGSVSSQYRKYVSQILSSTRLPSSTIMLGLFYLASRMKLVSAKGNETRSHSTVYRMLTTCLLLGSKFLDDNTFQNRSWAEVSSIPVKELNTMELEWLIDFEWSIHGRMYDIHEGFFMWREHWLAFEEEAKLRKVKEAQKLTPIDTNVRRSHSVQKPLMSPECPIPAQYQNNRHYDTQWVSPLISEPSPPSAAYSGPATPEYYNNAAWNFGHPSAFSNQVWNSNMNAPAYMSSRSSQPAYHGTQSYTQPFAPSMWGTPTHGCGCSMYGKCKDHYFLQPGQYGMQPVAC